MSYQIVETEDSAGTTGLRQEPLMGRTDCEMPQAGRVTNPKLCREHALGAGQVGERSVPMRGDSPTLDRLVREHLPSAFRFAVRLTGSVDEAEEVLQDAMLKAVRAWKTFRGEAQFRTWLFRMVINAYRDRLARKRSTCPLSEDLEDTGPDSPSATAMANELGTLIAARIAELPPRQREVLLLATYEKMNPKEIAGTLKITEANVHATLHVARRRLRTQLEPYLAGKPHDPEITID